MLRLMDLTTYNYTLLLDTLDTIDSTYDTREDVDDDEWNAKWINSLL